MLACCATVLQKDQALATKCLHYTSQPPGRTSTCRQGIAALKPARPQEQKYATTQQALNRLGLAAFDFASDLRCSFSELGSSELPLWGSSYKPSGCAKTQSPEHLKQDPKPSLIGPPVPGRVETHERPEPSSHCKRYSGNYTKEPQVRVLHYSDPAF